MGGERGRERGGVRAGGEAVGQERARAKPPAEARGRARRGTAAARVGKRGLGERAEARHRGGVEVQRRVVEVVDAELDQDEVGPVADAHVGEELGLGVRVVAGDAEAQDLDGRPEALLEPLRERLLERHAPAEGDRVAEHDDAERAGRLRARVGAIAEAVGVGRVGDAAHAHGGVRLHAVEPRSVGTELVQRTEVVRLEQPEPELDGREPCHEAEEHERDARQAGLTGRGTATRAGGAVGPRRARSSAPAGGRWRRRGRGRGATRRRAAPLAPTRRRRTRRGGSSRRRRS